jgi:hypothetical protein
MSRDPASAAHGRSSVNRTAHWFALSLKPNVAYLVLNFCALWKKQTTLNAVRSAMGLRTN